MNRTHARRLRLVTSQIGSAPIPEHVTEAAIGSFRETGVLPDHAGLAQVVTRKVLYIRQQEDSPGEASAWIAEFRSRFMRMRHVPNAVSEGQPYRPLTLREALFNEALHRSPAIRRPAREAIVALVARGGDVTDPELLSDDIEDMGTGTVGQHVLDAMQSDRPRRQGTGTRLLDRAREDEATWIHLDDLSDEERAERIRAILAAAAARTSAGNPEEADHSGQTHG